MKTTANKQFRSWVQSELVKRCKSNSAYSLRSFATFVDIDASSLSKLLSGKRNFTYKTAKKIASKLGLPAQELNRYFQTNTVSDREKFKKNKIEHDIFELISNWYYVALLELCCIDELPHDPKLISRLLSISFVEASDAIERLLRLNLIFIDEGNLKKRDLCLSNYVEGETSLAHKNFQKEMVKKSLESIDFTPQSEKDITGITMAIDESKISEAKVRIAQFRRELCAFLEDGKRERVFHLAVQFIPISKPYRRI